MNVSNHEFDAIVVGTGISGGWAAKELCENGLKTLVIERGRAVEHPDYPTAHLESWELPNNDQFSSSELKEYPRLGPTGIIKPSTKHWWMKFDEQPYEEKKPFIWFRGNHVGGRSVTWGRQVYRWSDHDFEANLKDGVAIDWPIRYADLAPWYDYVEKYIGVSGKIELNPQIPDGSFLPPFQMNCIEQHLTEVVKKSFPGRLVTLGRTANLTRDHNGRTKCKARDRCNRGCPYGAYFSSLSSTLPDAMSTNNMTLLTNSIVHEVIYDDKSGKATGVRVTNTDTMEQAEYFGRIIFLNASTLNSAFILMNSKSNRFPNGLGNDSGELGCNVMDHCLGGGASAESSMFSDKYYKGRRPSVIFIPRFQNIVSDKKNRNYIRGFNYYGAGSRMGWWRNIPESVFGVDLKNRLLSPGKWQIGLMGHGEMLPDHSNRVYLDSSQKDKYGLPRLVMDVEWKENERNMVSDMVSEAMDMLTVAGFENVRPTNSGAIPASAVHEMGTARMGRDPETSVLNKWNQVHAVKNIFVTDGSCMTSSSDKTPSLTYMALTVRAARYAVDQMKKGTL